MVKPFESHVSSAVMARKSFKCRRKKVNSNTPITNSEVDAYKTAMCLIMSHLKKSINYSHSKFLFFNDFHYL